MPDLAALGRSADRFLGAVRALADDDVRRASALPGWTRAHLLTHVAQAADSRTGMLRAARAGLTGEQYPSEQARADAIEAGARRPAAVIRADAGRAVEECLTAMRRHPAELWDAPAIWLRGGRGPVRGTVASLRSELEFHHVDLAAGYMPDDWPAEFVAAELRRVTALMDHRADAPAMTLIAAATVRIGTVPPAHVTGPPAAILAWLSGRGDGSGLDAGASGLPSLPPLALPGAGDPVVNVAVVAGGGLRASPARPVLPLSLAGSPAAPQRHDYARVYSWWSGRLRPLGFSVPDGGRNLVQQGTEPGHLVGVDAEPVTGMTCPAQIRLA